MESKTIIQSVTVGVVAGLLVYWLTSRRDYGTCKLSCAKGYKPLVGDIRTTMGRGTSADCQCCGLPVPETTSTPLATDYLCCAPAHAAAISGWNLGVSIQDKEGLTAQVFADKMASSQPHGIYGPNTVARPQRIESPLVCHPNLCAPICCVEIV